MRNKHNTPGIIKYPFWQETYQNPQATYACVNYGEAYAPKEIAKQSICIDGDIGAVLEKLKWKAADSLAIRYRDTFCVGC